MGYVLNQDGFTRVLGKLGQSRRIYAPVSYRRPGR